MRTKDGEVDGSSSYVPSPCFSWTSSRLDPPVINNSARCLAHQQKCVLPIRSDLLPVVASSDKPRVWQHYPYHRVVVLVLWSRIPGFPHLFNL